MTQKDQVASAIAESCISPNELDRNLEAANLVDGLFAIARALNVLAKSIDRLGLNEANTNMGALELLAKEVKRGCEIIAGST